MKVYISGKISGLPKAEYERRFAAAEEELRRRGYEPVNPCKFFLPRFFYWLIGYRLTLMYDLWRLSKCDGIYMIDGWQESRGARIEYKNALGMGLAIIRR